jgi:hypothetical protein
MTTNHPPPERRRDPGAQIPRGPSVDHDTNVSVAQGTDDPVEQAHPGFRSEQAAWRRRIRCSRRLPPLENGTVDPMAPSGRWMP